MAAHHQPPPARNSVLVGDAFSQPQHSHYGHRNIVTQPVVASGPPSSRLLELLDFVKQEFDNVHTDAQHFRSQNQEFEGHISNHIGELGQLREQYFALEREHHKVKAQYEDEIRRLHHELEHRAAPGAAGPSHEPRMADSAVAQPPAVGQSSSNLFSGIMNPGGPQNGSGSNGPGSAGPGPLADGQGTIRDREAAFGANGVGDGRLQHETDPPHKRPRADREREDDARSGLMGGTGGPRDLLSRPVSPPVGSNMRNKARNGDASSYPDAGDGAGSPRSYGPLYGRDGGPHPAPALPPGPISTAPQTLPGPPTPATGSAGNANVLLDLDPDSLPSALKKEGSDWMTMFNPKVKKVLDVELVHTLIHDSVVCCVKFSPDGKVLATGCNRNTTLYDTRTGAKICSLVDESTGTKTDNYIRSASFSPDGRFLATGSEDRLVRIWDVSKRRIRHVFQGHKSEIYSLAFSPDGRMLVSGSGDKSARVWDMDSGHCVYHLLIEEVTQTESGPMDAGVTSVAVSPDGSILAAGSLDTVVRLWDMRTGHLLDMLRGHKDSVYSVAFAPDGTFLVSGSLDKTLKMWDLTSLDRSGAAGANIVKKDNGDHGERVTTDRGFDFSRSSTICTTTLSGHKDYVLSVAVSSDGAWIVSGSKDRGVQFWDSKTAIAQFMLQGHKNSVISIAVSEQANLFATGSGDWHARIWAVSSV